MSNRDGFGSGFWLGTLVGGVVGGIVGASIASQRANRFDAQMDDDNLAAERQSKRQFKSSRRNPVDRMERARRSLDDKIEDLNNAIDSVRSSIGHAAGDEIYSPEAPVKPQKSNGFPQASTIDTTAE